MVKIHSKKIKVGLYCLFAVIVYILSSTVGSGFTIFGNKVDLLPVIVACVGLLDGSVTGAIVGFLVGVLYDISSVSVEGLYPAFYMFFGAVAGAVSKRYLLKIWASGVILSICIFIIMGLVRGLFLTIAFDDVDGIVFLKVFFAETILASAFSPIIFHPLNYITEHFKTI